MILHILKTSKFANSYINFHEQNFTNINNIYIVYNKCHNNNIIKLYNVIEFDSLLKISISRIARKLFFDSEKVIITGIFSMHYPLMFYPKSVLQKTYLQFWGGDFYRFRETSFRNTIDKIYLKYCLKHCRAVINLIPRDCDKIKQIFPFITKSFVAPVSGPSSTLNIYNKYLNKPLDNNNIRILVGNSATKENHHIELFNILTHLDLSNIKIICPLSYGDDEYKAKIIECGRELFGDHFIPIEQFLEFEKYIELLSTCAVGIFNNDRQQAMGNISSMLAIGRKVYIRQDTAMWDHYTNLGYKIFSIDDLKTEDIQQVIYFKASYGEHNFNMKQNQYQLGIDQWRAVYNS